MTERDAARLKRGQAVILRGRDAPVMSGPAYAIFGGMPVALGEVEQGRFQSQACVQPVRRPRTARHENIEDDRCRSPLIASRN